jgi:hypothetical protein
MPRDTVQPQPPVEINWPTDRLVITMPELGQMLGDISPETIRAKLRPRGDWPSTRIGKHIRFTRADVEEILILASTRPRRRRTAS